MIDQLRGEIKLRPKMERLTIIKYNCKYSTFCTFFQPLKGRKAKLSFLCSFLVLFGCCELVSIEENCEDEFVCKDGTEFATLALSLPSDQSIKKTFTRLILLAFAGSGASGRDILARLTNISSYRELVDIVNDFELVRAEGTEFAALALSLSPDQSLRRRSRG